MMDFRVTLWQIEVCNRIINVRWSVAHLYNITPVQATAEWDK